MYSIACVQVLVQVLGPVQGPGCCTGKDAAFDQFPDCLVVLFVENIYCVFNILPEYLCTAKPNPKSPITPRLIWQQWTVSSLTWALQLCQKSLPIMKVIDKPLVNRVLHKQCARGLHSCRIALHSVVHQQDRSTGSITWLERGY